MVAWSSVIEASGLPDAIRKILFPGAVGTGVNGESEDGIQLRISAGVQFNLPNLRSRHVARSQVIDSLR